MPTPRVGIVIVSHSSNIAEGTVELASQMAPDVPLYAAGGTSEGEIGTSFAKVLEAFQSADQGAGLVCLTDLGSAVMTAESAIEFLDERAQARVRIPHAALVKGAVAAAVASQQGEDVDVCARAAEMALHPASEQDFVPAPDLPASTALPHGLSARLEILNKAGLHARPASKLTRMLAEHNVKATINGVNALSVMSLMTLSLPQGSSFMLEISGDNAEAAMAEATAFVNDAFGEER